MTVKVLHVAFSSSVQSKRIDGEGKTITRKPALVAGGKRWRFSIDDSYGNTFYKEAQQQ